MGPAQDELVRHCLTNLISQIEIPHLLQVRRRKPLTIICSKSGRKIFEDFLSIFCADVTLLLVFNNRTANFVIRAHHRRINGNSNRLTVLFENRRNLRIKSVFPMISHFFSHTASI